MKRIIILIIVFCGCIVGYTQEPILKFEKKLTITLNADSIKNDSTITWNLKDLKGLDIDGILATEQPDINDDREIIVQVKRINERTRKEIEFTFKIDTFTEKYKAILQEGITLIPDSVKVVFQINSKKEDATAEMEKSTVDSLENPQQPIADDNVSVLPEHQEIWYIIMAGLGLILIIVIINLIVSMKIKNAISPKADNDTSSKIGYDDTSLKDEIKQISTHITGLESGLSKAIEEKMLILQESINSKLEEMPSPSEEQPIEKEDELPPVSSENEITNGYVNTPIRDYIEDKDIKQDKTKYCIYVVVFRTKDEAEYYINIDPEALDTITHSIYQLEGFSDETNGKVTGVGTVECGKLQRNGNRWKVVKPLKFVLK